MIPQLLKIKGIYSYKEEQVINFEKLISSGVFGIFGAVGSGKSSILEAMIFALYGRSDRLNKGGDNLYYNMLNLQSDEMSIDFTFSAGANNDHRYRALVKAKRNKKNFDQVKADTRQLYQEVNGDWQPISQTAEEIIGMSYEHFKQTIIIPQGKFREFIDLAPKDRSEMMKELFHLHRFDLYEQNKKLTNETLAAQQILIGQLSTLEAYTAEALIQLQAEESEQKKSLKQLEQKVKEASLRVKEIEQVASLYEEYQKLQEEQQQLSKEKPAIDEISHLLQADQEAKLHFKEKLRQLEDTTLEKEKASKEMALYDSNVKKLIPKLASVAETYEKAKEELSKKSYFKELVRDFKTVLKLQSLQKAVDDSQILAKTESEKAKNALAKTEQISQLIIEKEVTLEKLEAELPDLTMLTRASEQEKAAQKLQQELAQKVAQIKQLNERLDVDKRNLDDQALKLQVSLDTIDESVQAAQSDLKSIREQGQKWLIKQALLTHAEKLQEGDPCPICGATHHPDLLKAESDKHTENLQNSENTLLEKFDQLLQLQRAYDSFKSAASERERQIKQLEKDNTALQNELKQLQEKLQDINPSVALEKAKYQQECIKKLKIEISELRAQEQTLRKEAQQAIENSNQLQIKWKEFEQAYKETISQLNDPAKVNLIKENTPEKLRERIEKGEIKIAGLDSTFTTTENQKRTTELELQRDKQQLEFLTKSLSTLDQKLADIQSAVAEAMQSSRFKSIAEVHDILSKNIDVAKETAKIESFRKRQDFVTARLATLNQHQALQSYDPTLYETLEKALKEARHIKDEASRQHAVIEKQIKEVQLKLEEKNELLQKKETVDLRLSLLNELRRLFTGSGFVNYISTIYLKELCQTANIRFMTLTRNSLSLELNEDNTFIVRDHLNGGNTRLLKTLSGGQTFQAALCLALALAEKVKSLNQSNQSFFFLDEGFGSLDKNSLNIVFETLKSLRKENRIVGIISHVEDLQQEIALYANITLDKEKGSQVKMSYE